MLRKHLPKRFSLLIGPLFIPLHIHLKMIYLLENNKMEVYFFTGIMKTCPGGPGIPTVPDKPSRPVSPLSPAFPGSPGGPGNPLGPGGPLIA